MSEDIWQFEQNVVAQDRDIGFYLKTLLILAALGLASITSAILVSMLKKQLEEMWS